MNLGCALLKSLLPPEQMLFVGGRNVPFGLKIPAPHELTNLLQVMISRGQYLLFAKEGMYCKQQNQPSAEIVKSVTKQRA